MGLVLLWVFLLGCTEMRSTDIWSHIRTGQLILERGQVPWGDWYTYTDWNNIWIDLHWLFQVSVAVLYGWGGVRLLVLIKAGCLAATVAIGWLASGEGLPSWAKVACWVLPAVCLSGRALVRPEMTTLVFLALWLWIIFGLQERPRRIWWLPVIQLLWTNSHGLFVLGPVVGTLYLFDRAWRTATKSRWCPQRIPDRLAGSHLVVAVALTGVVSLVNPYFEEGALYPLVLFGELADLGPTENLPPLYFIRHFGFGNLFLLAEIGLWVLTAGSFLWLALEKRVDLLRLSLFLAFSYLAWRAQRNTNIFALVSGVVCCRNFADVLRLRALRLAGADRDRLSSTTGDIVPRTAVGWLPNPGTQLTVAFLVVWCFCTVTNLWSAAHQEGVRFGIGERDSYYIHKAAQFAGQPGFPETALVAQFGQAAVYIFHNAPRCRVFLDGRLDVISPETGQLYFGILDLMASGDRTWEEAVRDPQGHLPVVILDSRHSRPLINSLNANPQWRMVFADATAAVFLDVEVAESLELPEADLAPLVSPLQ